MIEERETTVAKISYKYLYVTSREHVVAWLLSPTVSKKLVAVDIETYPKKQYKGLQGGGLVPLKSKIRTVQLFDGENCVVLDFLDDDNTYLLADKEVAYLLLKYLQFRTLIAHNALFETAHFQWLALAHKLYKPLKIYCTMNAFRLVIQATKPDSIAFKAGLHDVAAMVLGLKIYKEHQKSDWAALALSEQQIEYCAKDAILPYILLEKLHENLHDLGMLTIFKLNTKVQEVVAHIHNHGLAIDEKLHTKLCGAWRRSENEYEQKCFAVLNAGKEKTSKEKLKTLFLNKIVKRFKKEMWEESMFSDDRPLTPTSFFKERQRFLDIANDEDCSTKEGKSKYRAWKRFSKNIDNFLVNVASGKQLSDWLLENVPEAKDGWPISEKSGQLKTDADTFIEYEHLDLVEPIVKYKKFSKMLSVYGDGFKKYMYQSPLDDCFIIHPNYTLCQTDTGRMSSYSPNVQNFVRDSEFRKIFIARPGYKLLVADFSQIEIRVFAYISADPVMIKVYEDGGDIHSSTATAISGKREEDVTPEEWKKLRFGSKSLNFCQLFGGGAATIQKYAKKTYKVDMSLADAEEYVMNFRETYHVARGWQMEHTQECEKSLRVTTKLGKVRQLHPDTYYTTSLNTIIQGTAAEILLLSLLNLYNKMLECGVDGKISNTVHDEIVCTVKDDEVEIKKMKGLIKSSMEEAMITVFPEATLKNLVDVKCASNWADAK